MVTWRPESIEQLRARYAPAVAETVRQLDVARGQCQAPCTDPAHVFDTEDGLRLIVSFDLWPDGKLGTHVSASIADPIKFGEKYPTAADTVRGIIETWQTIARSTQRPLLVAVSEGGIPHFFVERMN